MKLYVARHGRSTFNDLRLLNDDPKVSAPLSERGVEQAQELRDTLKDVKFDRIFVSELIRTKQTADIVNENRHIPVEIDARLNDHRSGFNGQSYDVLDETLFAAEDMWTARFNDGESIDDVIARIKDFLDELKTKKYDTVLIVTSMYPVEAVHFLLTGLSKEEAWDLHVVQGSYTVFELK